MTNISTHMNNKTEKKRERNEKHNGGNGTKTWVKETTKKR
jgi:hypothetical protein